MYFTSLTGQKPSEKTGLFSPPFFSNILCRTWQIMSLTRPTRAGKSLRWWSKVGKKMMFTTFYYMLLHFTTWCVKVYRYNTHFWPNQNHRWIIHPWGLEKRSTAWLRVNGHRLNQRLRERRNSRRNQAVKLKAKTSCLYIHQNIRISSKLEIDDRLLQELDAIWNTYIEYILEYHEDPWSQRFVLVFWQINTAVWQISDDLRVSGLIWADLAPMGRVP